jgi:hypothetical protein
MKVTLIGVMMWICVDMEVIINSFVFSPLKFQTMNQLTQNQALSLIGGKHWSEKKNHLIRLAKDYGIMITTDDELKYLVEIHAPAQLKRIQQEYYNKSQTGEIKTKFTPTDVKGTFAKVTEPVIGNKYHISWAYSAAVFKLVKITNDICYLDNPKYKKKQLLTCKLSELRHLAK